MAGAELHIGDEDGLQQAGHHQSQADREEDAWRMQREKRKDSVGAVNILKKK